MTSDNDSASQSLSLATPVCWFLFYLKLELLFREETCCGCNHSFNGVWGCRDVMFILSKSLKRLRKVWSCLTADAVDVYAHLFVSHSRWSVLVLFRTSFDPGSILNYHFKQSSEWAIFVSTVTRCFSLINRNTGNILFSPYHTDFHCSGGTGQYSLKKKMMRDSFDFNYLKRHFVNFCGKDLPVQQHHEESF